MQGNMACLLFLHFWLTAVFGLRPTLIELLNVKYLVNWGFLLLGHLLTLTCALFQSPLFCFCFCFTLPLPLLL